MSNSPFPRVVKAWLAAESGGREGDAERLFRSVAAALPEIAPPPGFSARVMAAVAVDRASLFTRSWAKASVAAGLFWVALLAWSIQLAAALGRPLDAADVVHGIARAWVGLGLALREAAGVLSIVRSASDAFRSVALSPEGALICGATVLLGAASLLALQRLLENGARWGMGL